MSETAPVDVRLLHFVLDDKRFAVMLDTVERVIRAVEVTPLPDAPPIVLGVINLAGTVLPVVNLRQRLGLPERELELSDQIIIVRTPRRFIALPVDSVGGIISCAEDRMVRAEQIVPGIRSVQGILKLDDGLMLIYDIDAFLALHEEEALKQALATGE